MWSTWSSYLLDNPNPAAATLSVRRELTSVSINFQWSWTGAISDELFESSLTALLRCRLLWDSGLCTTAKPENRNALRICRVAAILSLKIFPDTFPTIRTKIIWRSARASSASEGLQAAWRCKEGCCRMIFTPTSAVYWARCLGCPFLQFFLASWSR